jgi:ABC-type sugar transport system substrate-binding protein
VASLDRTAAQEIMRLLLQNDTQFDAVFAHNDNMILGAIEAFEELEIQRPHVFIGFDAIREAVQAVKQGRLTATIAQEPETMGRLSMEIVAGYFRGEELPAIIPVELSLVTK